MASTNKLNKADKPVDQSEASTNSTAVVENTVTQASSEGDVNTADNQSTDGSSETTTSEQPSELQQLVDTKLKEVKAEIEALKGQLKEKQKRMRELHKKPNASGPTKKEQAEKWLVSHPDAKLIEFINYAVSELDISPVYANTVFKQSQKPKTK